MAALAPVGAAEMKIGAWVGGFYGESYPQPEKENVDSFQVLQGRKLDLISYFAMFNESWANTRPYAKVADANGSILLVTWMANGYPLDSILAGRADLRIRAYAAGIKAWKKEVWLRPLHEANGDWYDWGIGKAGSGNTSAKCIAAWKHIVKIFRDSAVTNVKWVWTTNATNSGSGTSLMGHYPGDDWVDYNSIDGYNWGNTQSWSTWKSFEETFTPAYSLLAKQSKPILIAEFSSTEHGGDKAAWIKEMFQVLPTKFPKIMGLMWFSQSKSAEADWALNTSPAALEAWKEGIAQFPFSSAAPRIAPASAAKPAPRLQGGSLQWGLTPANTDRGETFSASGRLQRGR
ncbi:MAG TPA: glycosyl hydrolase [Fibrobacteria bacterium]|nr:glycosyl hydrolase [Fibrobacteria bacterium]HOX50587.1 glycosyl hydrolase [Fibrobacteria bacterium]